MHLFLSASHNSASMQIASYWAQYSVSTTFTLPPYPTNPWSYKQYIYVYASGYHTRIAARLMNGLTRPMAPVRVNYFHQPSRPQSHFGDVQLPPLSSNCYLDTVGLIVISIVLVSVPLQPAFAVTRMKRLPIICSIVPCSVYFDKISKNLSCPCNNISWPPSLYEFTKSTELFNSLTLFVKKSKRLIFKRPHGLPMCLNSCAFCLCTSISNHLPCPWPVASALIGTWP